MSTSPTTRPRTRTSPWIVLFSGIAAGLAVIAALTYSDFAAVMQEAANMTRKFGSNSKIMSGYFVTLNPQGGIIASSIIVISVVIWAVLLKRSANTSIAPADNTQA